MSLSGMNNMPVRKKFIIVIKIVTVLDKKNQDVNNALNSANVKRASLS